MPYRLATPLKVVHRVGVEPTASGVITPGASPTMLPMLPIEVALRRGSVKGD